MPTSEQPKEPYYDAMLERAKIHLLGAFDAFKNSAMIPWGQMTGRVPKVREQVWVDALKDALEHHRQIERLVLVIAAHVQ